MFLASDVNCGIESPVGTVGSSSARGHTNFSVNANANDDNDTFKNNSAKIMSVQLILCSLFLVFRVSNGDQCQF